MSHRGQPPKVVTFNGETRPIKEWAPIVGITPQALYARLKRRTVEQALSLPKHPGNHLKRGEGWEAVP